MPSLRAKVPLIELCYPNFLRRHCQSCNLPAESITLHILQGFLNPNWLLLMLWSDLSRIVMKIAGESGAVINNIASVQTLPLPSTASDLPHLILVKDQTGWMGRMCSLKFSSKIRQIWEVFEVNRHFILATIQDVLHAILLSIHLRSMEEKIVWFVFSLIK